MKKLAVLLILLAGCLAVPDADAQVQDTLIWFVAPFEVPDGNKYWWHGGGEAMQDIFVTELAKGTGYTVFAGTKKNRRQVQKAFYQVSGRVTEYGKTDSGFIAAVSTQIIDSETGEILWRDAVRQSFKGLDEALQPKAMFDKVMRPCVHDLVASLKAADL